MNGIKTVLVDNSFVTRLLKSDDPFHKNVVDYYEYFLENKITMFLSTIVVSEYAVADNPDNLLSLNSFQLVEFDYVDAKISGKFFAELKDDTTLRANESRTVIINDIKLFAQIHNRGYDAFISKDRKSLFQIIEPLKESCGLNLQFIDLSTPLNERIGRLNFTD